MSFDDVRGSEGRGERRNNVPAKLLNLGWRLVSMSISLSLLPTVSFQLPIRFAGVAAEMHSQTEKFKAR